MTQIGFTYNGGSHCIRHHSEAILKGTVTVSVEDEEMTYDSEGNETYPVWDTDDDAKDFQCEECLDEEIAKRDDPSAPARSEQSPEFVIDSVNGTIYRDGVYLSQTECVRMLESHAELLEALELALAYAQNNKAVNGGIIASDDIIIKASSAALAKARGKEGAG